MKNHPSRRRMYDILFSIAVFAVQATAGLAEESRPLMSPPEFQALPSKAADFRVTYGEDVNQFGELRVPSGAGPHPLVILIHGGCWKAEYATLRDLAPMGDTLKADGIATWNLEYRRLGQPGGGWPGTYLDIARGVDHVRSLASKHALDLSRVVVVGHSAGGHLAMWVAARRKLPQSSPLYTRDPLPIRGVVNLAGTADMEAFIPAEMSGCGDTVVESMLGGTPAQFAERYAQASAIKLLPLKIPQVVIWGRKDPVIPVSLAEKYTQVAKQAGDSVQLVIFPEAGHFEIASPLASTWPAVRHEIRLLLSIAP